MEKYIYNEMNDLWYKLIGDYYMPCLTLPEEEHKSIGIWGQRHKDYLQQHNQVIFNIMLIEGTLYSYLANINGQANDMFSRLVDEISKREGVDKNRKTKLSGYPI